MLTIKTPPTAEPVTLEEVRAQMGTLNVADITRDAIITARITAARQWAETAMRRAIMPQTWTLYDITWKNCFNLMAALQSVASIKYIDANGTLQTLAADQYLVDTLSARVYPAYGITYPGLRTQYNSVQIEHIAGYANAAAVPQPIKEAIMFLVSHWENYQASIESAQRITTVPWACEQLIQPYRDLRNHF